MQPFIRWQRLADVSRCWWVTEASAALEVVGGLGVGRPLMAFILFACFFFLLCVFNARDSETSGELCTQNSETDKRTNRMKDGQKNKQMNDRCHSYVLY